MCARHMHGRMSWASRMTYMEKRRSRIQPPVGRWNRLFTGWDEGISSNSHLATPWPPHRSWSLAVCAVQARRAEHNESALPQTTTQQLQGSVTDAWMRWEVLVSVTRGVHRQPSSAVLCRHRGGPWLVSTFLPVLWAPSASQALLLSADPQTSSVACRRWPRCPRPHCTVQRARLVDKSAPQSSLSTTTQRQFAWVRDLSWPIASPIPLPCKPKGIGRGRRRGD